MKEQPHFPLGVAILLSQREKIKKHYKNATLVALKRNHEIVGSTKYKDQGLTAL